MRALFLALATAALLSAASARADEIRHPPVELGRSGDPHVCRAPARTTDGRLIGVLIHCWTDGLGS